MIMKKNSDNISLNSKKFSIIIAFHNDLNIKKIIESLLNQTFNFNNIQIILIDCGSYNQSVSIVKEYEKKFSNNILLLSQNSTSIAKGRNLGLKYATGKYVNFLYSNDYLDKNTFVEINKSIEKYSEDIICLPMSENENNNPKNDKIGLIDIKKSPNLFIRFIGQMFIKKELIYDLKFDDRIFDKYDIVYICKLLLKTNKYRLIDSGIYYKFRKRNKIEKETIQNKEFYINQMNYFICELIDYSQKENNNILTFIKYIILENLISLLKKINTLILSESELKYFFDKIKFVLDHFTNDEITKICNNHYYSSFLIATKNNDLYLKNKNLNSSFTIITNENNVQLLSKDNYILEDMSLRTIILDFVTLRNDNLYFSGYFESIIPKEYISIVGVKKYKHGETELFDSTSFNYPTRLSKSLMGLKWENIYNFDIKIPIKDKNEISNIKLIVKYKNSTKINCKIEFRQFCNISYFSPYYVKDNRIIMFNGKFNIMKYSYLKMFKYELKSLINLFKNRTSFFKQALFFRVINLLLYPIMRHKEIWIIMDRKESGDDNGEHFFKFALKQNDKIKKFFSINKNSPDYKRLQKECGNILSFGSIKHRFYYTFADKIISSQGSEFYLNPFNRDYPQTAGISNVDFYFLQHGITLHDISEWLVKYDRNIKMMMTASTFEYNSLISDLYNYDKQIFKLTGFPRYDNLDNKKYKKQIIIMPTWRKDIKNKEEYIESEYFNKFNSLINNEKLIDYAKENGYDILFKPHPEFAKYLDYFDKNDYVHFDNTKKYQELFNESAILITDYSSIAFDFAYLKKPILYYHYGNDFHYNSEKNYFDYETMGFGKVIKQEDELIKCIVDYINNDCKMEDFYKKKVNYFFKFHDKNNSKRCYDNIRNDY